LVRLFLGCAVCFSVCLLPPFLISFFIWCFVGLFVSLFVVFLLASFQDARVLVEFFPADESQKAFTVDERER
jgi:hypothetical protein